MLIFKFFKLSLNFSIFEHTMVTNQPPGKKTTVVGQASQPIVDAVEVMPLSSSGPATTQFSQAAQERLNPPSSPGTGRVSQASNTLEHQMQIKTNLFEARGEPQLVGLTRIKYAPQRLALEIPQAPPCSNYILEQLKFFYPNKPQSKRVQRMVQNSKQLALSSNNLSITIDLPQAMLVEQVNLYVEQAVPKKQSEFSEQYQLLAIVTDRSEICLKSAHSECSTRTGKIEYNTVGVAQRLVMIFAKKAAQQTDIDQIQIHIQRQAADIDFEEEVIANKQLHNIMATDDDDDYRILDALPTSKQRKSVGDKTFPQLLRQVEVIGFNVNQVPAITNLTYFMNQSLFLQRKNQEAEAALADFMTCQLLMTTKRATQAAELYRKLQIKLLPSKKSKLSQEQQYLNFVNCAVYELLIADSMSPNTQLSEKMHSMERLSVFLRAEVPSDAQKRFPDQLQSRQADCYSQLLVSLPFCLRFAICCLSHRYEIFILEAMGCQLDYGMVFILKAMLSTYPIDGQRWNSQSEEFDLQRLFGKDLSILEYLFKFKRQTKASPAIQPSPWLEIEEPQSGSRRAMINIYNNVLDTYISVLSSVSSHILHSIFYDVIAENLDLEKISNMPVEVRVFTCKIADKIFTICQGDLILTSKLLETMLQLTSAPKSTSTDQIENAAQTQVKNLWVSIRQKVLPNYSYRGFQDLVRWLVKQLTDVQCLEGQDEKVRQIAEIVTIVALGRQKSDEDANQLIRLPVSDQYGGGPSSELYLVLSPLVYWLEYSIEGEDRFPLFMQVYQAIKDILVGLPRGQSDLDIVSVIFPALQRTADYLATNSPSLNMIKFLDLVLTDMVRHYQKTQRAQPPVDIQQFFQELLANFVQYIPYSLYEEIFIVFEKILSLCPDVLTERTLRKCIIAMVDKYTVRSKQHKQTVQTFMKFILNPSLFATKSKTQQSPSGSHKAEAIEDMLSEGGLDQSINQRLNYFDLMSELCFFSNPVVTEISSTQREKMLDFRSSQDCQDLEVEKLQFFIEFLGLMNESHISIFTNLIIHPNFKTSLLNLVQSTHSNVRLKASEIAESLCQYFTQYCPCKTVYELQQTAGQTETMDAEFITHERLFISQVVIAVVKQSLQKENDCYLQFNSLILLDYLFQNLLPVPSFQNELLKAKRNAQVASRRQEESSNLEDGLMDDITIDLELLSLGETTPEVSGCGALFSSYVQMDVLDSVYLRMRMKLVLNMWPYVQQALNSPWSNIRSISYGLICSMLRIDIDDYPQSDPIELSNSGVTHDDNQFNMQNLSQIVLPMLHSLLNSKESESKAGGLNILGSFCGLSYDFSSVRIHKHLAFFQRNSKFVSSQIWKLVWQLQEDWDITIKEASVVLIQLCAPRGSVLFFESIKESREMAKLDYLQQLKRVSDIYAGKVHTSEHLKCPIKSEQARRAMAIFPSQHDCSAVLQPSSIAHNLSLSQHEGQHVTFEMFMFDREICFTPDYLTSGVIQQSSDELAQMIYDFDPSYEDKRFTQPQISSRRRQMEIELGMQSKQQQQPEDHVFFVDSYSDDQIQEIISIFRNDFKPPKSLWIEKQPTYAGNQFQSHQQSQQQNQEPDYFQDIYADAIEQFNQHQLMMQQKQQDEVQQQISGGLSATTSQSSIVSMESLNDNQQHDKHNDSQNSSTPSPTNLEPKQPLVAAGGQKKRDVTLGAIQSLHPQVNGPWPTSPVLVSSKDKLSKNQDQARDLQVERLNLDAMEVVKDDQVNFDSDLSPSSVDPEQIKRVDASLFNDGLSKGSMKNALSEDNLLDEVNKNCNVVHNSPSADTQTKIQSKSDSDFNLVNLKSSSPRRQKSKTDKISSNTGSGSNITLENHKMSRKTAQTYLLSNLNQGYIQNIGNLKLINSCLSQQSPNQMMNLTLNSATSPTSSQHHKLSIKTAAAGDRSNEMFQQFNNGSTRNQKQSKKAFSNQSPETGYLNRKGSKPPKKSVQKVHATKQQQNNLADLNYFIKSLEKGMSIQTTPSNIIKKVEDQMRHLVQTNQEGKTLKEDKTSGGKPAPLNMKLLALNQLHENITPSNQALKRLNPKQSSSAKRIKSKDSESRNNEKKHAALSMDKTRRDNSESHERDQQSSARYGVADTSHTMLNQPAILTDRSSQNKQLNFGFKNQAQIKQANSTRYDSAGLFLFNKGGNGNQLQGPQKGYSTLVSKSVMSPTTLSKKEHQQSGGLTHTKLNLSANQITTQNNKSLRRSQQQKSQNKNSQDFEQKSSARGQRSSQQQTTQTFEQGEQRKHVMSPEITSGGKQSKKKRAGHSHNNSSGLTRPTIVLPQQSYY